MRNTILEHYKIIVDFLGKTLGPDYEVVLQDLTDRKNAIIAIANNHISGRQIGSPITNTALQLLSTKVYETSDYVYNYKGVSESGHILRSSTMFIKDAAGEPIGLLCINFDDSRFEELAARLYSTVHPSSFCAKMSSFHKNNTESNSTITDTVLPVTENFPTDITTLMQKLFDDATSHLHTPTDHLNQQERKEVMTKLYTQGLFQMKGAISFVAKQFSCSNATVYRYLNEITD